MGKSLTLKVIEEHLVSGDPTAGNEIALRIDQTLTQDATGTMAYLQFEAMGIPRVRTKLSVSSVDHNMLQAGFENADDHRFLQSIAAKYGIYFSRPGNGICHQVHLERFSAPGGLDVAVAMGGGPFYIVMPRVVGVLLRGRLQPWVSGKDIILELLRLRTVKGGVARLMEDAGEGVGGAAPGAPQLGAGPPPPPSYGPPKPAAAPQREKAVAPELSATVT